jgi:hypothetical protein
MLPVTTLLARSNVHALFARLITVSVYVARSPVVLKLALPFSRAPSDIRRVRSPTGP